MDDLEIEVLERGPNDWAARVKNPKLLASGMGQSPYEAIGDLVAHHPHYFNCNIAILPDKGKCPHKDEACKANHSGICRVQRLDWCPLKNRR